MLCCPELHLCRPPSFQLAHLGMPSFFGLTDYYTPKLTIAVARVLRLGDQTGKYDNSFLDKRLDGGVSIMKAMSAAELSPLLLRFKEPNSGPVPVNLEQRIMGKPCAWIVYGDEEMTRR
eukprot:3847301-Pleurochrysis_carterae.AAC.1